MSLRGDGPLVGLAAAAAFAAAILAIRQHSETTSLGYRLAAAQREGEALEREAARAERRIAALRAPNAVLERRMTLRTLETLAHQPRVPALPTAPPAVVPAPGQSPKRRAPAAPPAVSPNLPLRTANVVPSADAPRAREGRRP